MQHADPEGCEPCCGKAMTCFWQLGASRKAKSAERYIRTHTAGITCTDHSSFGKLCGMAGPHIKIFCICAAVMRQVRPKIFIADNVTLQPYEREFGDINAGV